MDKIKGFSPEGQYKRAEYIRRSQAHGIKSSSTAKMAKAEALKLDSHFLTQATIGAISYFPPTNVKSNKIGTNEVSKVRSYEEATAEWSGKLIKTGLALSEKSIGESLIVAGAVLNLRTPMKGLYEGHISGATRKTINETSDTLLIGKYIKRAIINK